MADRFIVPLRGSARRCGALGPASLLVLGLTVPGAAAETFATVAVPAADEWRHLSFEKRHEQMTFVVHPTLAERYRKFFGPQSKMLTCSSCHGADAERNRYQIVYTPIDDLQGERVRQLYLPGAELSSEQHFKRDVITPLMARLLGVAPYDADTGLGFSCFGCHPREGD